MSNNETLADILEEMQAVFIETDDGPVMLGAYADRIEAAVKRERETAPGNVAALREALAGMTAFWDAHGCAYAVQVALIRESKEAVEVERVRVMAKAREALAAPPRNCDRFCTEREARSFFDNAFSETEPPPECDTESKIFWYRFAKWLFAPAEKGGK